MTQAHVNSIKDIVFFLGYRTSPIHETPYFCADCIDIVLGFILTEDIQHYFISIEQIPNDQFTENHFNDESNYCAKCKTPLYDLKYIDEQCPTSNPSSNKQRQRFKRRRRCGRRNGGF